MGDNHNEPCETARRLDREHAGLSSCVQGLIIEMKRLNVTMDRISGRPPAWVVPVVAALTAIIGFLTALALG